MSASLHRLSRMMGERMLMKRTLEESHKGIALLIVLWVMTILIVTVFSFSLLTRADTYGTAAFKDSMEKQYLAEAGIERGIAEIIYRSINDNQTVILEGREVWKTDGSSYSGRIGKGAYMVRIFDEAGKISLNSLTDASGMILKNLLVNLGAPPEDAETIVDSILDWKDDDNLHRLYGAEDDYYLSLKNPYKARNAAFETLEELLRVKGVTPDILFGTDKKKGVIPFLTIISRTNLINIIVAPREVLAALPGVSAEMADQIVAVRGVEEIKGMEDVMDIIGRASSLTAPYVSGQTGASMVYTIEGYGYKDLEKRSYPIRATVAMEGPSRYRYLYYRSPAEVMP